MTYRVRLRALKASDVNFINTLRKDDGMESMTGGNKRFVSLERDTRWINELLQSDGITSFYLAVAPIDSDEIVGYISVTDIDYRNGTCTFAGIKIAREWSGMGIGGEVMEQIIRYVFEEMRMERMQTECLETNAASIRMMERSGFCREGLRRNAVFKNGRHSGMWLLGIVREDYEKTKKGSNG